MKINSLQNQNFGKIVIAPTIRKDFFKDAMTYIGKNDIEKRKNFYTDILDLVERDKSNSYSFVKVCMDNTVRAVTNDNSTVKTTGSNLFSSFLSTLKYTYDEKYVDFLKKYNKSEIL